MSGWENFFIGDLSATAALTGLVFVGISINLKTIVESDFLPNNALEALITFVSTLFIGLVMLIPNQSFLALGIEVLVACALYCIIILLIQRNTLHKIQPSIRNDILRIFFIYHLVALSLLTAGITFLIWGANGYYWIVAATLLSFTAAFIDIWLLIIEINR